jgi:hypothetical protein
LGDGTELEAGFFEEADEGFFGFGAIFFLAGEFFLDFVDGFLDQVKDGFLSLFPGLLFGEDLPVAARVTPSCSFVSSSLVF